jgi:hypothetical protein
MEPEDSPPRIGPGVTVYTLDGVRLGQIDAVTLEAFRVAAGSGESRWLVRDAVHHVGPGRIVFVKAPFDNLDPWTWRQAPNRRIG